MRYAILADIHSNLAALEAVLKDIQGRGGADEIWCLGDIVGYGPDPHECIELVRRHCSACVAGNHDWAAVGKVNTTDFNPEAAEAVQWTHRQLKPDEIRYLEGLPLTLEKGDFTLVHGSPREPIWEYILAEEEAEENLKYFKTPYCFIGHSHIPLLFQCQKACSVKTFKAESEVKTDDKRLIINPGSVGQPRDRDPRASYALYESEAGILTLHRVEYDIAATQQRMRRAALPERLIDRLAYGR